MRILFLAGWLLVPVGVGLWHFGPGQERVRLDDVSRILAQADRHAAAGQWAEAVEQYDEALKFLPADRLSDGRRIRLEKAKAQMLAHQLPVAHGDLKTLCEELRTDAKADPKLLAETRSALAQSQYYMTWLMRLEGLPQDVWEPEIEAARQTYRLLAEQSESAGDAPAAKKNREDLESAVRLARMDLNELQGLPLPAHLPANPTCDCDRLTSFGQRNVRPRAGIAQDRGIPRQLILDFALQLRPLFRR